MADLTYDVVIVGGGIAGLSAGLHTSRSGLRSLVIERMMPGGQVFNAAHIENMPGILDPISGVDLSERFHDQATRSGLEIEMSEVTGIEADDPYWLVHKYDGDVRAKALILAGGSSFKKLELDNEEELHGSGVSVCATCDGPFFQDQVVGVVGNGDTALDEALVLTDYASKVIIFAQTDQLAGQVVLQERVLADPQIEVRWNTAVTGLIGDDVLDGITTRNTDSGETSQVDLMGLFIFVGLEPNTSYLSDVVALDKAGHIETDIWMRTSAKGIFAAGDIRQNSAALLASSAGDGTTAAVAAKRYVDSTEWPE
jgi:thioredoxin reductase (NADPH)